MGGFHGQQPAGITELKGSSAYWQWLVGKVMVEAAWLCGKLALVAIVSFGGKRMRLILRLCKGSRRFAALTALKGLSQRMRMIGW